MKNQILSSITKINLKDFLILSLFPLIGIIVILISCSRWGIGYTPDSCVYISIATNLLQGNGFNIILPYATFPALHFPPLFPAVIAVIGVLYKDILNIPFLLNTALFGVNIFLISFIVYLYCRNIKFSLLAGLFSLISTVIVSQHTVALSEPLLICFSLLFLYFLVAYLRRPRPYLLLACSCVAALAFLTRYIGFSYCVSGFLVILLLGQSKLKKRCAEAGAFLLFSCLPIFLWLITRIDDIRAYRELGGRSFAWHPVSINQLLYAASTFWDWLCPVKVSPYFKIGASFAILLILLSSLFVYYKTIWGLIKRATEEREITIFYAPIIISVFVYLFLLLLSISFGDMLTSINTRLLSPVYVLLLVAVICVISQLWPYLVLNGKKENLIVLASVLSLFICLFSFSTYRYLDGVYHDGIGYTGREWENSQTIKTIAQMPEETEIITNDPGVIYLLAGKHSYLIPFKINPFTGKINEKLDTEVTRLNELIQKKHTVVVYFKDRLPGNFISEIKFKNRLSLIEMAKNKKAIIYKMKKQGDMLIQ